MESARWDQAAVKVPRLCEEVAGVRLRDQRLSRRLEKIVETLGAHPQASIPSAFPGRAETEATYRFLANEKVSFEEILSSHYECTRVRCGRESVVLLVQDTTELDLTRPTEQMEGAGPLGTGARRGAFLHPLLAVTPQGVPLGLAWSKVWTRQEQDASQRKPTESQRRHANKYRLIEDKESHCWVEGLRAAREVARACPQTRCVCVADSAADLFEMFAESRASSSTQHLPGQSVELLVRACKDRVICDDDEDRHDSEDILSGSSRTLLAKVRSTPLLYTCQIKSQAHTPKISSTRRVRDQPREARTAQLEVRATQVRLQASRRHVGPPLEDQTLRVILVEEPAPPAGQPPVQWLLLTSLVLATHEQVREAVSWYARRWEIEVYFRTLKSGCRIESRQFEFLPREMNFTAIAMLIAWRVQLLTRVGRSCPDLPCDVVFTPAEWKAMWMVQHETVPWSERMIPPGDPPRLGEMLQWVASLGGHVIRSPGSRTPPGTQTLWQGLSCLQGYAHSWVMFGPNEEDPRSFFLRHRKCVVR